MDHARELMARLTTRDSARLRRALSLLPGVKLTSDSRADFYVRDHVARLRLDADDSIQVVLDVAILDVAGAPTEIRALQSTHELPGNLRFARGAGRLSLVADTLVDGEAHLLETFRAIEEGLLAVLDGKTPLVPEGVVPIPRSDVEGALQKCDWGEQTVVSQESGWEVRPRRRGDVVPIQIANEGHQLRFSRTVVSELPAGATSIAVAHQALRFNAQLRQVRVALTARRLVVETRLHATGQLSPAWMARASHAVACAWQHVRPPLCILAEQADVAASYATMFGCE